MQRDAFTEDEKKEIIASLNAPGYDDQPHPWIPGAVFIRHPELRVKILNMLQVDLEKLWDEAFRKGATYEREMTRHEAVKTKNFRERPQRPPNPFSILEEEPQDNYPGSIGTSYAQEYEERHGN